MRSARSALRKPRRSALGIESLEARQMLDAQVVIAEFMAENGTTIADEDGQFSDWIELRNLGADAVDLGGWHLTNDPADADKWTLPAVSLAAGQHLLVFASLKDRATAGATLHTNFTLPAVGGYVALVRPDLSVAHTFGPNYPIQVQDVAYGLSETDVAIPLVDATNEAVVLVPTQPADMPADWNAAAFDASAWPASPRGASGPAAVGFETTPTAANYSAVVLADGPTHYYRFEETSTAVPARDEIGIGPSGDRPGTYTGGITLGQASAATSMGSAARFNGAAGTYVNLGTPFHVGDSVTVEAWVNLDPAANKAFHSAVARWSGSYELDVNQGDGVGNFVAFNNSGTFVLTGTQPFTRGAWHHLVGVFDGAGGTATVYLDGVQGTSETIGGALQNAGTTMFIGATRDGAASGFNWTGLIDEVAFYGRALTSEEIEAHYRAGAGGPTGDDYAGVIETDIESQMAGVNATALVRTTFDIADPARFDRLALDVQYDDGFVAYLNGVEVARRNAPAGPLAWNATATTLRPDGTGLVVETIDLSAHLGSLTVGQNVLAIHALNADAADNDLLLVPRLTAVDTNAIDPAVGGSYLNDPTPSTTNTAGSPGIRRIDHVVVNEVVALGDVGLLDEDGDASDWIELFNAGPFPVDLDNAYLTDNPLDLTGWRFPSATVIPPGGYLVVFASGKDRNRGELHTDFRLAAEGEYVALVKPDGLTIVSSIGPFGNQYPDVSFGRAEAIAPISLVSPGDAARVLVPTSPGDIDAQWTSAAFDDSSWPASPRGAEGPTAIGFDTGATEPYANAVLADAPTHYWRFEESSTATAAEDSGTSGGNPGTYTGGIALGQTSAASNMGGAARFDGASGTYVNLGSFHAGDSITVEAWVNLDAAAATATHAIASRWVGSWELNVNSADVASFFGFTLPGPTLRTSVAPVALTRGQWHHVVGVLDSGSTGSASATLTTYIDGVAGSVLSFAAGSVLRDASAGAVDVKLGASRSGSGSTGFNWHGLMDEVAVYDRPLSAAEIAAHYQAGAGAAATIDDLIATDIEAEMAGIGSTALVRVPFSVADPSSLDRLTLRMQYDDGFVAYLNGVEIARRGVGGASGESLAFNATASGPHSPTAVEEIDVSAYLSLLVGGTGSASGAQTNVLAVHAANASAADRDFFVLPELIAADLDAAGSVQRYFATPTPGGPNGTGANDRGPVLSDVGHSPHVPQENEDLVVTSRVTPLASAASNVTLHYRVMFAAEVVVPMADNGLGADAVAGDGVYAAVIPHGAFAAGEMVRYYVTADDAAGNDSRWPLFDDRAGQDQSAEYLGTVAADPNVTSQLPILQWFVAPDQAAGVDSASQIGGRASLFYDGAFYDNVFARTRGATATTYPKKPYKFDFPKGGFFRYSPDVPPVEEINVNSTFQDKALVRAPLSFETYRAAGVPAPDAFNIRVERNGEFFSVATMVEQVDDQFLERRGFDPDGAMYKFVSFNGITSASANVEKKTRRDEGNADLAAVVAGLALGNPNRAEFVLDNFDIPAVINYLAAGTLFQDFDRTVKNYYLYRDTNGDGQWQAFPWDKDLTFGLQGLTTDLVQGNNDLPTAGSAYIGHPLFGTSDRNCCGVNNLFDAVFDTPVLREMFLRRLRTLMDEFLQPPDTPVAERHFETRFDELAATLSADAALDLARWGAGFGTLQNLSTAIDAIKANYLAQRRVHLYETHSIDAIGGGGELTTLISGAPGATTASYFVPTDNGLGTSWTQIGFAPSTPWPQGPFGIGYEDQPADYADLLRTAVRPQDVCATCTSVFIRVPFEVGDLGEIENLTLRVKYDDGFVAYLNGVEVARRNVTGAAAFDTPAANHPDTAAVAFEDIAISSSAIVAGANVLAFHAINSGVTSSDMLLLAELVEGVPPNTNSVGIPHAQATNPPIEFGAIEVNPASGNQDEEYIELVNPNATAVDLSQSRLEGGVAFTFAPGTVIPAGGSIFVSPDVKAFRARSEGPSGGQGRIVVGGYSGRISNRGETIEVLAADGSLVASVTTPEIATDAQKYLRVTEIMYHPADATATEIAAGYADQDDFEYIELRNISSGTEAVTLDLTGVRFADGVDFEFTGSAVTSLAPGEFVLVVRNAAAMELRFGGGLPIAGEFAAGTGLSNAGETIEIDDAEGNTIQQFTFDDDGPLWHPTTDGGGFSLVVADANGSLDAWSRGDGWRPSSQVGGSPGRSEPPDLTGDINGDGRVDLVDLAILQAHLGLAVGATRSMGDLNGDGRVSRVDAGILASNFGAASATSASSPVALSLVATRPESPARTERTAARAIYAVSPPKVRARSVDRALLDEDVASILISRSPRSRGRHSVH